MLTRTKISVSPKGVMQFIYTDRLASLLQQGASRIERASHVEPDPQGGWYADMSPVGGPMLTGFALRQEALDAEVAWLEANMIGQTH